MKAQVIRPCILVAILFLLSACVSNVNGVPEPRPSSDTSIAEGRRLIASYGCGACHSIPGVAGADARAAPPLDRFYERSYIAGRLPNTWENLIKWIQNPQQVEPDTAMPNLGVSADDAHEIAAYLYHQPNLGDLIRR